MIRWLVSSWHIVNRLTDLSTLWPVCKEHTQTLDHAKIVFMSHVLTDTAWTDHYTEAELIDFVDHLT